MNKVIIYSTPTCVYCKVAKEYFKSKGVAYTERNVAGDDEALEEMLEKSGGQMGVPVIDINGTILSGFSKTKIDECLN